MDWLRYILAAWMLPSSCLTALGNIDQVSPEAAPVYRFWSPVYGRHFYTIDRAERDKLLAGPTDLWTYEETAFRAFPLPSDDRLAPVHRFWSGPLNAHFYTIDEQEADKLITDYPQVWTYEGVGFYAYPADRAPTGTVPVHRFWSGSLGTHFYTTSDRERFSIVSEYADIWQYEGVAYYVYPAEDSSAARIIRGPTLQGLTPQSATIVWETDVPADTRVDYGIGSAGPNEVRDPAFVTLHKAVLSGLAPNTPYVYTATSGPASQTAAFATGPQPDRPFRLAVYGDSRTYPDVHAQIARNILEYRPQLVFHTGDLVSAGRDPDLWETEFFEPAGALMAGIPVIPVPGNHEYFGSGAPWFFYFFDRPLGEGWFALTYGNARIIGLDTSVPFAVGSPQHDWLLSEFTSVAYRDATWRLIILHEPPFTATAAHGGNAAVRDQLVPLIEQYGVDAVFCGHSHAYERYLHRGITYIVTGGGGGPLYPLLPDLTPPIRQFGRSVHHHCLVDVDPIAGTLTISAVDVAGNVFDRVKLVK